MIPRLFNPKGNLFAATVSFAAQGVIRLGSSLILTRILTPEAYGVVSVLLSVMYAVEMLADLGVTVFMVREQDAEEARYLNTAWTMRLGRAALNGLVVFFCAPLIASLYHAPDLVIPLRVISLWFLIAGLESMSFPLAVRRNQSRLQMYSELTASFVSTLFSVVYCYYSRTYWGMVYAILLNRLLITLISFRYYPELRPKLQFDKAAARAILRYTRLTVPSGILTLILSQFDKVIFLRLFDLRSLGIYSLANNIAAPIESLILNICHVVLFPRCAHDFRTDRANFVRNYYSNNVKLITSILLLPAGVGGMASLIIATLYDPRYALAAHVLEANMLRVTLVALATPAEVLLISAGQPQVILIGSLLRTIWMVVASLAGNYFYGFTGFVYGAASSVLPALIYYLWLQRKKGLLIVRYEFGKILFALGVVIFAHVIASALSALSSALPIGS